MTADLAKARQEAETLISEYGIAELPIRVGSIAKKKGVLVFTAEFKAEAKDKISGLIDFDHDGGNPKIIVNDDIPANEKPFTVAHELGHYLLHRDYAKSDDYHYMPRLRDALESQKSNEKEQEADCFARSLLVPAALLKKYSLSFGVRDLSQKFAVSEAVIVLRLGEVLTASAEDPQGV